MGHQREPVVRKPPPSSVRNPNPQIALALRCSLILNLALAGVVAWALMPPNRPSPPAGVLSHLTNRILRTRSVAIESAPRVLALPATFHWSEAESADYRVYLANLRAIGCPERTVRDIIVADVDQLFIQRGRALLLPLNNRVWWLLANEDQAEEIGEVIEKEWEALVDERKAVFNELFGDEDPYPSNNKAEGEARERARWVRTLDFLSPEKQQEVIALRKACEQAVQALWKSERTLTREEEQDRRRRQREMEAGRDQQLNALLTPDELAEYQLRTSESANVRHRLSRIELSEAEVRTIARLDNERRQQEAKVSGNQPETRQQRDEIQEQTKARLKEALGEARYADYQRAADGRYDQICQVIERHGLAEETARAVYDMQHVATTQAAALRQEASRPLEERQALLQAIRDETERSLKAALGPKPFATLEQHGGASWLSALTKPVN